MAFQVTTLGAFLGSTEDPHIILQGMASSPTQQVTHTKPLKHQHRGLRQSKSLYLRCG